MRYQERLGAATVIAIVALWFHVGLSLVFAAAAGDQVNGGGVAFLSVLSAAAYAAVAIGLQRRHPAARPFGIALSALAYVISLTQGRFISSVLLILIPLLMARPVGQRERRFSPPPALEEGVTPYEQRRLLPRERRSRFGDPRAPWDTWD